MFCFVLLFLKCFLTAYHNSSHWLFDPFIARFAIFLWCFPKQNVCKLNFFLLYFALSFFRNIEWTMDIFVLFLIIITCFCFCSVNIISWFTWVSLFNNVLFFFCFSVFLCVSIFSDLTWACTRFLNDSLNERVGAAHVCECVWVCVGVTYVSVYECRALSVVRGCFALFFVYYIFFNFSLCFIYGACLLYLVG